MYYVLCRVVMSCRNDQLMLSDADHLTLRDCDRLALRGGEPL